MMLNNITNGIIERENSKENLDKLYAQSQIYSDAKIILGIEIILTIVLSIALSLISNFFSSSIAVFFNCTQDLIKAFITSISILIAIMDITLINNYLNNYRKIAASIQDSFDCNVLSLPDNAIKISKPDPETICKYAQRFINKHSEKDRDNMKNWYYSSKLNSIPLPIASIMCQRTNCWWDNYLRKNFIKFMNILSVLVFVIIIVISLINELSFSSFILNACAPFLCLLSFTIKQNYQHNISINVSENLKTHCNNIWERLINNDIKNDDFVKLSRQLQDEIYQKRVTSPLIFDWFYKKCRNKQQSIMNDTLDKLIDKYNSK